jgi:hypothetical protein
VRGLTSLAIAILTLTLSAAGAAIARPALAASPLQLNGARLSIQFDATDPERVTSLTWIDGSGTSTGNLVAEGGPLTCTDPSEFFGQSYGAPEGTTPDPVVAGHLATLSERSARKATIKGAKTDCRGAKQLRVTTAYQLFGGARASEIRVARTLGFTAHTKPFTGVGVRPYVPRLSLGDFSFTLLPNGAGTGVTYVDPGSCPSDCLTATGADWNGSWFADLDPPTGYAMIVLRDPSMTSPVDVTVNNDGDSDSNLSSFVLLQPQGGWHAAVQEVEYLCFEDLRSWPQSERDAAQLPAGCGP